MFLQFETPTGFMGSPAVPPPLEITNAPYELEFNLQQSGDHRSLVSVWATSFTSDEQLSLLYCWEEMFRNLRD